jgi:hypothetical protein
MTFSGSAGGRYVNLTAGERERLRQLFRESLPEAPCRDCGGYHLRACGRVRRQVFLGQGAAAGNRVEVEYWEKWDDSEVIYPEEVYEDQPGE